ncbi:hypothetical protein PGT21_002199 [Puccinia graminis f. sp. tritici]|uniref:Uncharacterized protein n=2 Tax=Puccinia graminis f. sp. tritici TaxID=56615 RepID=H6QTW3_PUCGT|nr:uncharacterized protein PGTG_22234 [Puccinia graminis f. sp. tritici CRL 75-36-700-3]KAA1072503.1 hypothetical protein PGTUg99_007180 [Puccinia graminis f. sp. tritici]EHS64377.1 hypothetical protein PGTG_22234 [Puccinia graminis f. sp. tritici CRL 75-36-700-3]KAA1074352.1 hypothetical protein PGT21_002236 [Puccinia graminis f. sp. tritici]KAA1077198.1 hypothetical protein PGTUg99_005809 [Puccinia graminis f. sp. tritici]KAA1080320.1 hypothetical protein PGT21_002199 [Puccinia graminis f. s
MLFKYLLAPIALAAASVPYDDRSISKQIDFKTIVSVTETYKQSITNSCGSDNVQGVVNDLTQIYTPVVDISEKFHNSVVKADYVNAQAKIFGSFLVKFEAILKVVSQHPKVYQGCRSKVPEFDSKFSLIISDFKKYNVDFRAALGGVKLDYDLWVKFGFKSQISLGLY